MKWTCHRCTMSLCARGVCFHNNERLIRVLNLFSLLQVYLYDTAGGEHHRTLTSNYYEKADAAILVYSIEDNFTFQNLHYWIDEAQQFVDPGGFTWALLGNKCDLPAEILEGQVKHLADELKTELSFFISAKTGENVKNAFEYIIESVHRAKLGQPQTSSTVKITSVLHPQPQEREVVEFEDSSEDIEKDQEEEETPQPQAIATEQSNPKKSCKIS